MHYFVVTDNKSFENQTFEISDEIYGKLDGCKKILLKVLKAEEIYDQIVESYWDYKSKLNYWNMRSISGRNLDYSLNHEIRSSLNRLAFNVLNLGKLYLDLHYYEEKKNFFAYDITKDDGAKLAVTEHRKKIFSENIHYRIGCKLRSYSQHSSLPVNNFTTGIRNVENTTFASFKIIYEYRDLIGAKVPKGILNTEDKFDLTEILDGYVFAIAQMHALNRNLISKATDQAKTTIRTISNSYYDKSSFSECSGRIHPENGDAYYADLEWFSVVDYLHKKHMFTINYSEISFDKQSSNVV